MGVTAERRGVVQRYRCLSCASEWFQEVPETRSGANHSEPRITMTLPCRYCGRAIVVEYDPSGLDQEQRSLFCPYPGCHELTIMPGDVPGSVRVVRREPSIFARCL
jgi:DNA-directed RNA polymerase subunit RPC12/RpoP